MKRSPESAGLDMMSPSGGGSSDDDEGSMHDVKPNLGSERGSAGRGQSLKGSNEGPPAGKKTKGRVKIKMEFIDNKLRRYTTFSKRKTGIMKKVIMCVNFRNTKKHYISFRFDENFVLFKSSAASVYSYLVLSVDVESLF